MTSTYISFHFISLDRISKINFSFNSKINLIEFVSFVLLQNNFVWDFENDGR